MTEEKWFVTAKRADFQGIADRFGISPVTARLIRNRDIVGDAAIDAYLQGGGPHRGEDPGKTAHADRGGL